MKRGQKLRVKNKNQSKSSENLPLSPGVFISPHFGYVAAIAKSCYNRGWVSQKLERGKKSLSVSRPPSPRFSAPTVESWRRHDASKNFCSFSLRGSLRFSRSALAASPPRLALAAFRPRTSDSKEAVLQHGPFSCRTCVGCCTLKKKKVASEKTVKCSESKPAGGGKKKTFLSSVRQVAFPQLSGFSLVPFGRIFAALRHLSSAAEPRLTRSTEIKRREK